LEGGGDFAVGVFGEGFRSWEGYILLKGRSMRF
jgi:hypothetical protein